MKTRLWNILLLWIGSMAASAQIMECISADGKKEFAQSCPSGTVNQKQMAGSSATRPLESAAERGGSAQKSTSQMEIEFQQRRIAREQAKEKQDNEKKATQAKCAALRQRLSMYENARGIKRYDQATGKWTIVEDDQRPAIIAQIQNDLRQCD